MENKIKNRILTLLVTISLMLAIIVIIPSVSATGTANCFDISPGYVDVNSSATAVIRIEAQTDFIGGAGAYLDQIYINFTGSGFTTTDLQPLSNDATSGASVWKDHNNPNGDQLFSTSNDTVLTPSSYGWSSSQAQFEFAHSISTQFTVADTDFTFFVILRTNGSISDDDQITANVTWVMINGSSATITGTAQASVTADTIDPSVLDGTIIAPNGGENWSGSQTITWDQSKITDSHLATNPITLYYSNDSGSTWYEIANGELNDGSYLWDTTTAGGDAATYMINITAVDNASKTGYDASNATFTVDNTAPICQIEYNSSETYFADGTLIKIYANFTEALSGMNDTSVEIAIATAGDGGLAQVGMSNSSNLNYTYDWVIPAGSDDNGTFTVSIYGKDNASNNVAPYPATNGDKIIDNTGASAVVSVPEDGEWYASMGTISGTCNDALSGVGSVNITIYNATSGNYWNGSSNAWEAGVRVIGAQMLPGYLNWNWGSGAVTWFNGTSYKVNATAIDNVSNAGTPVSNEFTFDDDDVSSSANTISPYWQTSTPLLISFVADDSGSGLHNVTLYYNYSANNASGWTGWTVFGNDSSPWDPTDFSFNFPMDAGYYQFYTIAIDNVSNSEASPLTNDTICGYDPYAPDGTIILPADGAFYKTGDPIDTNITGNATDPRGVPNVYVEIFNSTDGTWFNGATWQGAYTNLSANLSGGSPDTDWWYDNAGAFPDWNHNITYYVNISAQDTAGNWNSSADSASFLYDEEAPAAAVTTPTNQSWISSAASIAGTSDDDAESGVASVNVTLYNQTGDKYWTDSAWGDVATALTITGLTSWSIDTLPSSWDNGSTYYVNVTATDNAGNVGSKAFNWFRIDTDDLTSTVTPISGYWKVLADNPLAIAFTASDVGSGLHNVTLYYNYSANNASGWTGWTAFGVDSSPGTPTDFNFNFPQGAGYYTFHTIAIDNASNSETKTVYDTDAICGYDPTDPTSDVDVIAGYWKTSTPLTITATPNDTMSGIKNVTLWWYNSTDNNTWSGPWSNGTINYDTAFSWEFAFANGSGYYRFHSIAADNATNAESFTVNDTMCGYDPTAPTSSATAISGYWKVLADNPLDIAFSANDATSGLSFVTLYYNYSANNASGWTGYLAFGSDNSPWDATDFSFNFPQGAGYYRFYTRAVDNASLAEAAPAENDTWCGYDPTDPTSDVDVIAGYWKTSTPLTITATPNDTMSGIKNVTLWWYNSTDNNTWSGPWSNGTINYDTAFSWEFAFANGSGYYRFHSIAADNATNAESFTVNDTMCGYDPNDPTSSVVTISPYWYGTDLVINVTANDAVSGVASVALYYNYSADNASGWTGWNLFSTNDTAAPYQWTFTFDDGLGYYEFYSIAIDAATNPESAPAAPDNDTICGYDTGDPMVSNVLITDTTISSTTLVKDTDAVNVTATIIDLQLGAGDTATLLADLTGFGGGASTAATGYNGTVAWWVVGSVTCTPSDGTVTVTLNISDPAANYNDTESDTITADNTAPTLSYAVMDAENDGNNVSYVDVYFSETLNTSTVVFADFNISISGISPDSIAVSSGNMVTVRFDTEAFETGGSPTVGIAGSIEDVVGNPITSGTVVINTYRISMAQGWNLFSIPADTSGYTISSVLPDDFETNLTIIWGHNATTNTWTLWRNSSHDGDLNIEPGRGYWISMNTADTLIGNYDLMPIGGSTPPEITIVAQSWNLVGHWFTWDRPATIASGLSDFVSDDIGGLYRYNPTGQSYSNIFNTGNLEPGDGYWLSFKGTTDKIYNP